jgi:hypothetical protein
MQGKTSKWGLSARLGKIIIKIDLGKNHQWLLNLGGILMKRLFTSS